MASNPLAQLSKLGQSPWYDQMTRSLVSQGTLKKMIEEDGLRGLTSNPTIFEKAISGSKDYEDTLRAMVGKGAELAEIYDALVVGDIASAADVFLPVYESTKGEDGFVSIEVSPLLAQGDGCHGEGSQAPARKAGAAQRDDQSSGNTRGAARL